MNYIPEFNATRVKLKMVVSNNERVGSPGRIKVG